MSAKSKADELSREILQSNEFRDLVTQKRQIEKNSDHMSKIRELKSKQMELQKLIMPDSSRGKSKAEEINKYFQQLNSNLELKKYFDAERRFNDMVGDSLKLIGDNIEKNLK